MFDTVADNVSLIIGVYIGIGILAAVVMSVSTLFLKSAPRPDIPRAQTQTQTQKQPAKGILKDIMDAKSLLRRRRADKTYDATPAPQPVDRVRIINEQPPPQPQPPAASPEPVTSAAPSPTEPAIPIVEPAAEKEPEVNIADILLEEPAESAESQSQEEPEEPAEAPDEEHQERPKAEGGLDDLFATEIADEDDVSRFAESLETVDTKDLIGEAQDLLNQIRGAKKG
jgi:outer membrane biosynthesis protein TonB